MRREEEVILHGMGISVRNGHSLNFQWRAGQKEERVYGEGTE